MDSEEQVNGKDPRDAEGAEPDAAETSDADATPRSHDEEDASFAAGAESDESPDERAASAASDELEAGDDDSMAAEDDSDAARDASSDEDDSNDDDADLETDEERAAADEEAAYAATMTPAPPPEPPRRRGHVAPALIALDRVDEDDTFQIRPEGDLSRLATDLARLGQLFPIDLRLKAPDRFQIICGFRRVAALRFLQRERVLARLHTDLSDEDALLMALAAAIHEKHVSSDELEAVRGQLEEQGRLFPEARDMLEKALAPDDGLAPEGVEEEVDADELAGDVTRRLGDINQDLALLADVFSSLDDEKKAALLEQLRYSADLVAYLEGK